MKKAQAGVSAMVITGVVVVLLSIVALQVVDEQTSIATEPQSVAEDTFTGSNSTAVALEQNELSSNATCNCSPFNADLAAGTILHKNDTCNGQTVSCSYSYYDDAYQDSGTTRTITGLVPVIWAVMLLTMIFLIFKSR